VFLGKVEALLNDLVALQVRIEVELLLIHDGVVEQEVD